jgi:hypothetical protein
LFRTTVHKGSPEGRSLLRSSYVDWVYKKNFATTEAIGIERHLAGYPVMWVPANVINGQDAGSISTRAFKVGSYTGGLLHRARAAAT